MALHLLAKTAELSSDNGNFALQQIHKLPGPWELDYTGKGGFSVPGGDFGVG